MVEANKETAPQTEPEIGPVLEAEKRITPKDTVRSGIGPITGCDLTALDCLRLPFQQDPFFRLRPPLSHEAMALSLELAAMTYHLELEDWMNAGWTDCSIQIDNTLQSGVTTGESTSGEQMRALMNGWKLYRAKAALRERNPIMQILGALRQRERSDTIKAVTLLRKQATGKYVVAIGFMGTGHRFYDWFSNLRFTTEEGFHKGFSQLTEYFEQSADRILFPDTAAELGLERLTLADILTEMKSADSRFFLWMAGHSQGAAVMQIFTHKLLSDWRVLPQNVVGYGFASPTVATGRLVYDPARYPLYHVLNSDDVVPRVGALLHLGLCLEYQAHEAFRKAAYGLNHSAKAVEVRKALQPFVLQMKDTLSIMEICVAFCYCLLEEKGEENLSQLIDKRWTVAPIERVLTYAGDKALDVVKAIAGYAESGYMSLTGHGMDKGRVALLKGSMGPVVRQYTMRQLLTALHDVSVPPHLIMRDNFRAIGAYSYIENRGWTTLKPFIWVKQKDALPIQKFAESIPWTEAVKGADAPSRKAVAKRRTVPAGARKPKGVRGKGIGARRREPVGRRGQGGLQG